MVSAMPGKGLFYWLRSPRNEVDVRHDERVLALARLLLTASCLLVAVHSSGPRPFGLFQALAASYFVYSLLAILWLEIYSIRHPLFYLGIHFADVIWAVNLIVLIDLPVMAAGLFLFMLLGAAFRWGFWEVQLTSVSFCLLLVASCGMYGVDLLKLWHYQNHLDFILESSLFLVLTLTVGFLAEAKAKRTEAYAIGRIIESVRIHSGLRQSLRIVCMEELRLFRAKQVLVAISEKNVGRSSLYRLSCSRGVLESIDLEPSQREQFFFKVPASAWRNANTGRSGRRSRWLMLEAGKWKRNPMDSDIPDSFQVAHPFRILLAVTLVFEGECTLRAFVIDPMPYIGGAAGLRFLDRSLRRVGPLLHDVVVVERLKTRAEAVVSSQVARELHDGVIQSLSSINLRLEEIRRKQAGAGTTGAGTNGGDSLAPIQKSVQDELATLREFAQRLRSLDVDSGRLLRFLTGLTIKFQCEHGVAAQFVSEVDEVRLRPRVCAELAYIVQEGLINVRKHSDAKEVLVRFSRRDGDGVLDIIDNGRGFSFSGRCSHEELQASGKGPVVIMERARAIRGDVSVESEQGRGAWVRITFPYEANC